MRVLFEDYDWFRYQRINDFINVAWKLIWQFREKKKMGKMIDFYDIFKKNPRDRWGNLKLEWIRKKCLLQINSLSLRKNLLM